MACSKKRRRSAARGVGRAAGGARIHGSWASVGASEGRKGRRGGTTKLTKFAKARRRGMVQEWHFEGNNTYFAYALASKVLGPVGRSPRSVILEPAVSKHFQPVGVAVTCQQLGRGSTKPLGALTALEASVVRKNRKSGTRPPGERRWAHLRVPGPRLGGPFRCFSGWPFPCSASPVCLAWSTLEQCCVTC